MEEVRLRREELEQKEIQLRKSFKKFEKFLKVSIVYISPLYL